MRKFTKIALVSAAILASIGIVCLVMAAALGMTTEMFRRMVDEGKFAFQIKKVGIFSSDTESGFAEVKEVCKRLDVEYGAGLLEIYYGDVDEIQVENENVPNYEWNVDGDTLYIEGGNGTNNHSDAKITIIIPDDYVFEDVELELGASNAKIADLRAESVTVEVGAGNATFDNMDVKNLAAEVGIGKLSLEVVGEECDYNYNVECGIGKVKIGTHSYSGLGAEKHITNHHAEKVMNIECGIGEVLVDFME